MHEMAITENILNIALEKAEGADARRIVKVNLVIGKLTGVVEECVGFYFDFMSRDTIAEKAVLNITMVPTRVKCRVCGADFALGEYDWTCPGCGGSSIEIISGKELFVESIEVE